jgi:hypothetical protein
MSENGLFRIFSAPITRDNFSVPNNDCPKRPFPILFGLHCFLNRNSHLLFISVHTTRYSRGLKQSSRHTALCNFQSKGEQRSANRAVGIRFTAAERLVIGGSFGWRLRNLRIGDAAANSFPVEEPSLNGIIVNRLARTNS